MIKIENLVHKYTIWKDENTKSEKTVLDGISLDIPSGQFVAILGPNGSGKSTLAKHLNVLLLPNEGTVWIDGKDTHAKERLWEIRSQVGMVFQYPEYQLFEDTVIKDIGFGPRNMGLSQDEVNQRVMQAVDFVGLDHALLEKSPFDLSGGKKRRAAIAGVIAMDPDVLVLDEPTAGLDPQGRDHLLSQIKAYHKQRQNTVILVSHSMEDIARVADRVLVMNESKVFLFDETAKVFSHAKELEQIGLRVPQVTKIMMKLHENGYPVDPAVFTLEQAVKEILPLVQRGAAND